MGESFHGDEVGSWTGLMLTVSFVGGTSCWEKNGIVVVGALLGVACTCSLRVIIAVIPSAEESKSSNVSNVYIIYGKINT